MADMLAGIAPVLKARQGGFVLVSMAAGLSCQSIADMAGGDYPVIRIMPNTPAAIGQGVVQVCGRGVSGLRAVKFRFRPRRPEEVR